MRAIDLSPIPLAYGHATTVHALAFSPNGEFVIASVGVRRLWLVRVRDAKTSLLLIPPNDQEDASIDIGIKHIVWSRDGTRIAAHTRYLEIVVWSLRDEAEIECEYIIKIPEESSYLEPLRGRRRWIWASR